MAWPRWTEFRNAEGSPWYSIGAGDILVLRFALGVLAGDPQHVCAWQAGTASVAPSNWDAMPSQSRSVLSLGKSFRLRRCYVTSELSLAAPPVRSPQVSDGTGAGCARFEEAQRVLPCPMSWRPIEDAESRTMNSRVSSPGLTATPERLTSPVREAL